MLLFTDNVSWSVYEIHSVNIGFRQRDIQLWKQVSPDCICRIRGNLFPELGFTSLERTESGHTFGTALHPAKSNASHFADIFYLRKGWTEK